MDVNSTIDPNDPIEKLILKSVRIGEIAAERRFKGIGPVEEIEALEKESERLWKQAKRLGRENVSESNYENLANAFLTSCIEDYEDLLSGGIESNKKNFSLLEDILEHQQFVKINLMETLEHIKSVYKNQFVPYVNAHRNEIIADWKAMDKKRIRLSDRASVSKHHCPLCGGALRPIYLKEHRDGQIKETKIYKIGCTGCKLSCR